MPPYGVKSETDICDNFKNFLESVSTHYEKIIIYNYILTKANEALKKSPQTDKSKDNIYEQFHNIMDEIEKHTSQKVKNRIYLYIEAETLEKNLGGKRIAPAVPAYKLNGEKVSLLINKKKLHRSVYVKGNGKAKYCKINNEFVLLSKLKNKII
jgi:hypothetical protein